MYLKSLVEYFSSFTKKTNNSSGIAYREKLLQKKCKNNSYSTVFSTFLGVILSPENK